MGACASCLGFGQQSSQRENGETSRLLYDDPYRSQYGSHVQPSQRLTYQPDPESVKREREALESICHAMSDNVIDVFPDQPQATIQSSTDGSALQINGFRSKTNGEVSHEELMLRTIKKGRGGPIFSTLGKSVGGWKAVQEAIG